MKNPFNFNAVLAEYHSTAEQLLLFKKGKAAARIRTPRYQTLISNTVLVSKVSYSKLHKYPESSISGSKFSSCGFF